MSKVTKAEKAEAIERLRELCPPGSTIYCIIRHVSRSGMSRTIAPYVILTGSAEEGGGPRYLATLVSRALEMPFDAKREGVKIGGCGMDMCFALVHNLSYVLHGNEAVGDDAKAAAGRPFAPTREQYRAGYSLRHETL